LQVKSQYKNKANFFYLFFILFFSLNVEINQEQITLIKL